MTGKQEIEVAERLAAKRGVTLFTVGDVVVTRHGDKGTISDVSAYGSDEKLFWGMCDYTIMGEAFGPHGMRVDFVDAHLANGGFIHRA